MVHVLTFIHWNPNPEIFNIGVVAIRWYGLLFASSFFFGYFIMLKFFKKEGIEVDKLDTLTTYMVIGTVVGARLGHCLFYEPAYYLSHPVKILEVWEGGLASHGAALGIILSILIFAHRNKLTFFWVMDRVVIVVALAGLLIRTGNLMNSEIFGHITSLPWGFYFLRAANPAEALDPRHPTEIYEGLCYFIIFLSLWRLYYVKNGKPEAGLFFGLFLIGIFGVRFFVEFLKEPQVGFEQGMPLNMGQLLSIPFVILGIYLVYRARKLAA
ncbi:MAG: prolipoprotein diacylglyceryl transferase [Bacteroidetes bacterium]|nr:prolipoprotein diacylglyceryl transferase [Bacteroidota bacterium]